MWVWKVLIRASLLPLVSSSSFSAIVDYSQAIDSIILLSLIKHGARLNSRDNNGWSPLLRASRFGHLEVARLLLDRGVDVNAKKKDLWTAALHLASANGHDKIVELLLERGADVHVLNAATIR
jgi:ankyrin repeat protein